MYRLILLLILVFSVSSKSYSQKSDSNYRFYGLISYIDSSCDHALNDFQGRQLRPLTNDPQEFYITYNSDSLLSINYIGRFGCILDDLQPDTSYVYKYYLILKYYADFYSKGCMRPYLGEVPVIVAVHKDHPNKVLFIAFSQKVFDTEYQHFLFTSIEDTARIYINNGALEKLMRLVGW